jgi:hypothetical protein
MAMPNFVRSALVALSVLAFAGQARADDTIKTPNDHPTYTVELEPHLLFGWANLYGSSGYGIGGRASIPIIQNGFIPTINNSVAISFGLDLLHYDSAYFGRSSSANFLFFPVAMQWNFFVHSKWSVFGEPGIYIYKGFFDSFCDGLPANVPCTAPHSFGVQPMFNVGGRYHFSEHVALTMRVGYPTFSIGVSFM